MLLRTFLLPPQVRTMSQETGALLLVLKSFLIFKMSSNCGLQEFHVSVQEKILSHLDPLALGRVSQTCHCIRSVALYLTQALKVSKSAHPI